MNLAVAKVLTGRAGKSNIQLEAEEDRHSLRVTQQEAVEPGRGARCLDAPAETILFIS